MNNLLVHVAFAGLSIFSTVGHSEETIKVALNIPLSGPFANLATSVVLPAPGNYTAITEISY